MTYSPHWLPLPLDSLLAELPSRVRMLIDTKVFAGPEDVEPEELWRLAALTRSHIVGYDLRIGGDGLALHTVVGQAYIAQNLVSLLKAAEQEMPPWVALVAYARPAEMRLPEEVLLASAAASRDYR